MIDTLYPTFRWWSDGGSVYITSDTHFDDPDCKLMNPNWPSPEDAVKKIKELVHRPDTLIHLGDVGDPSYMNKIKCYKVLILGNHDDGKYNYYKQFFDEVYTGPLMIAEKIILSHEPLPFVNWALNIHGHCHGMYENTDKYHYNVCSDVVDWYPVDLKWIIKQGYLAHIDSLHRQTIDGATERKYSLKDVLSDCLNMEN